VTDPRDLDELLRAIDGDVGCDVAAETLGAYVELELAGEDPDVLYPGTGIHLRSCPACRADHDGLVQAVRSFGDIGPN